VKRGQSDNETLGRKRIVILSATIKRSRTQSFPGIETEPDSPRKPAEVESGKMFVTRKTGNRERLGDGGWRPIGNDGKKNAFTKQTGVKKEKFQRNMNKGGWLWKEAKSGGRRRDR